ncbi:MAG: HAD family phosphatase [Pirellulales bacterium]
MAARPPACPDFFYFDMGKVLLDFDHDIACRRVASMTGLPASTVRRVIFESGLEARYERGELTTEEFHAEFTLRTGARISVEQLTDACSDIFTLKPEMPPLLAALRAAGRRIGLLSNTCDAHWRFVYPHRYSDMWQVFEVFALSFELKSLKPEPDIYERAAQMAGVPLPQLFFVDDRPENVAQARQLGIDALLFESPAQVHRELRYRGAF